MTTAAARSPLFSFWERYAFSIGAADFQWLDVVLASMAHGGWPSFERRLAEGLACAARAAAENVLSPEPDIDEAATNFRYERDLISASDMTAWLVRVGLSTENWMAYITRDVLRRTWAHELDALLDRYPPSQQQLEAAAIAEGIGSGLFEAFEASFCERAATAFEASPDLFESGYAASASHLTAAVRLVRQHTHWLTVRPEAESVARVMRIFDIDDAYRAASDRLVSEETLSNAIDAHRLDWVLADLDSIAFASEEAAREAILCLKEDGLSMQEVAALARHPVTRVRLFLEDASAEYRDQLLSAQPGSVIGPLLVDGRYQVTAVVGRTTPARHDERIVERARGVLLARAGRRAARDHVKRRPAV